MILHATRFALAAALLCGLPVRPLAAQGLPEGFVHLADVAPGIRQDIRYAGSRNFLGRPAAGYEAAECILTRPAAEALARVQADLVRRGLTLVVWDCYRPRRAVADFMAWTRDPADRRMRAIHYPALDKRDLPALGYVSPTSAHSRGSTVDLGFAPLAGGGTGGTGACSAPRGIRFDDGTADFGTSYDCFDTLAHVRDPRVGREAAANRALLAGAMRRHGFRGYAREWWHFQLAREPFAGRSFDFPVQPRRRR